MMGSLGASVSGGAVGVRGGVAAQRRVGVPVQGAALAAGGAVPRGGVSSVPSVACWSRLEGRAAGEAEVAVGEVVAGGVRGVTRRAVVGTPPALAALAALGLAAPEAALAAKLPAGFSAHKDGNKTYVFIHPQYWQAVEVDGVDVVYKDVVEPLESVAVTKSTVKNTTSLADFGGPAEVGASLLEKGVFSAPGQTAKLLSSDKYEKDGLDYYKFEFTVSGTRGYFRHNVGIVTLAGSTFYTLVVGTTAKRWSKIENQLNTVAGSFTVLPDGRNSTPVSSGSAATDDARAAGDVAKYSYGDMN